MSLKLLVGTPDGEFTSPSSEATELIPGDLCNPEGATGEAHPHNGDKFDSSSPGGNDTGLVFLVLFTVIVVCVLVFAVVMWLHPPSRAKYVLVLCGCDPGCGPLM